MKTQVKEDEHKSDGHDSDEDRMNVDSRPPILKAASQSHYQSPFMTPKRADRDQVLFTPSRSFINNKFLIICWSSTSKDAINCYEILSILQSYFNTQTCCDAIFNKIIMISSIQS